MTNALQACPRLAVTSAAWARWLWLPLVFSLWMSSSAHALAPQVKDGGGFFTAAAVEKANREILEWNAGSKGPADRDLHHGA